MTRRSTRHRDGHRTQPALLGLGERQDPRGDALEARAVARGQAIERASKLGSIQKQRSADGHVAETLSVLP